MTFTYTLTSLVGRLRFEINDTDPDNGVKPNRTPLTDEEIAYILTKCEDDLNQSVAAACELLARAWSNEADYTIGPRKENCSQVAKAYERQATALRLAYGGGGSLAFSVGLVRDDGYALLAEELSGYT
jgi:hypothetical protein